MTFTNFLRNRARNFLFPLSAKHRLMREERGRDFYTILITVFLSVYRTHLKNHRTRDATMIKTRRRGGRNPVDRKTMNNCSSKGLYIAFHLLFLSFSLCPSVSHCISIYWHRQTYGCVGAHREKKSHAGNAGDGREREKRKRAADTTAKNVISCRECQAERRSSGRLKIARQSSRTV